jgi:S-DNA-T family DNA segregation ATPase FtsK/SpoIIIE
LDVIVTEAKFVNHDGLGAATSTSAKQLTDTLAQLTQALNGAVRTIDQDIWLARLSDLLVSQTVVAAGEAPLDTAAWRGAIRERRCSVQVWGYSHIFVNEPQDLTAQVSLTKGIPSPNKHVGIDALQEVFGPGHVRELLHQFRQDDYKATAEMRLRNGHPPFGKSKLYHLASGGDKTATALATDQSGSSDEAKSGKAVESTTGGAQSEPKPSTGTVASGVQIKHDTSAGEETNTGPADEGGQQAADEKTNSVIVFLEARAALVQTSEEEGLKLRRADCVRLF